MTPYDWLCVAVVGAMVAFVLLMLTAEITGE